jgi:hypothetical protein
MQHWNHNSAHPPNNKCSKQQRWDKEREEKEQSENCKNALA